MICLGIDPGIQEIGLCIVESRNFQPLFTTVLTAPRKIPPDFVPFADRVEKIVAEWKPELAGVEWGGFPRSPAQTFWIGSMVGVFLSVLQRHSILTVLVTPSEVKRQITGNGNATKVQIKNAVRSLFSFPHSNPHLVDAFSIAVTACLKPYAPVGLR